MLLAGCSAEQIVAAVKADRGSNSAGAKRQAKYRALKKEREEGSESVDSNESDVTLRNCDASDVTERDNVTDGFSLSPVPLLSPTPPNNPLTPIPSSKNKTSAREIVEKASKRGHRLPANWTMNGPDLAYALGKGLTERDAGELFERFCSWAWSASGPNAVKVNWHQAWQGWVQREAGKIIAARASPTGRPLSPYEQRRQETKDILNDLDNFAKGSSIGGQGSSGFLRRDTGERPEEIRGGFGGALLDLSASGDRAGD